MVAESHPLISVNDYLTLERKSAERHEFIDGVLRLMSGGTIDHDAISVNVVSLLHVLLRGSSCRVHSSNLKARLSPTRYVYPDAAVTCDENDRGRRDEMHSPRLIVEVLSPTTEAYDRGDKFGHYRGCATIQEYMLVNTRRRLVEVYRRDADDIWILHIFRDGSEVTLESLDRRFALDLIYEGIELGSGSEAESATTDAP